MRPGPECRYSGPRFEDGPHTGSILFSARSGICHVFSHPPRLARCLCRRPALPCLARRPASGCPDGCNGRRVRRAGKPARYRRLFRLVHRHRAPILVRLPHQQRLHRPEILSPAHVRRRCRLRLRQRRPHGPVLHQRRQVAGAEEDLARLLQLPAAQSRATAPSRTSPPRPACRARARLQLRRRRRRLRQRRLRRSLHLQRRPQHPLPQQWRRHLYRCHGRLRPRPQAEERPQRGRGLVRLRQRRPARPDRDQLHRLDPADRQALLHGRRARGVLQSHRLQERGLAALSQPRQRAF